MKPISKNTIQEMLHNNSGQFQILVSENLTGHRIGYLKALLEELSQQNRSIVLILQKDIFFHLDSAQQKAISEMKFSYIDNFRNKSEIMKLLGEFALREPSIKILFWDADNWMKSLLVFRGNLRLLFMRPYLTGTTPANIIRYVIKWVFILYLLFLRKFEIGILGIPYHQPKILPALWFDDPVLANPRLTISVKDELQIREDFGIGLHGRIILVPGYLTSRKNPKIAILSFGKLVKLLREPLYLVFAGKIDPICQSEILKSNQESVVVIDKFLSESEYEKLLSISTIVLLPYSNRGSSGVVLEGLAFGKNVILTSSKIWRNAQLNSSGLLHLCSFEEDQISKQMVEILQSASYVPPINLSGVMRDNVISFLSRKV